MSDLRDLYLVACPKNAGKTHSDTAFGLDAKKESSFGQDTATPSRVGLNANLALTYAGATEPNLSIADKKNASRNALEAQQYAKQAIEAYKSNRAKKEAVKQQIADLESIRKKDEEELKIIRVSTGAVLIPKDFSISRQSDSEGSPELSDARKLYYKASKERQREVK